MITTLKFILTKVLYKNFVVVDVCIVCEYCYSKSQIGPNRAIPCTAGRILNRFSADIGFLDDLLPYTFLEYVFVS